MIEQDRVTEEQMKSPKYLEDFNTEKELYALMRKMTSEEEIADTIDNCLADEGWSWAHHLLLMALNELRQKKAL